MDNGKNKSAVWSPLFFSLVLVLGMIFGFRLRDTLRNKRDVSTVFERNDRIEEIIDLINEKYVDTINSNKLYQNAIAGILKNLDPHTTYIPADELQNENEDLEGAFSGIGVEFSIVRDTIQVTAVTDMGPASKAGIRIGDQLIKVGDSLVAGAMVNSDKIRHLLRGKQRSSVDLTLKNIGTGKLKKIPVVRDIISVNSIEASFMLDKSTGYIKISKFSANTYSGFIKALKSLQDLGAKQLVVDLRENPGGYLEAATSIADEFLNDRKLIVYTKGLHANKTEYRARETGKFETGKLVLLVDEGSASASEILAGAIQDWDRGVIIGRRTFGKGLVQEQYEMADGAGLRLTVAKYYTPSGRCIQRPFSKGKDVYLADYENRFTSGELIGAVPEKIRDTVPYYTANKRIVYAGGGIKPDIFIPYDTIYSSSIINSLTYSTEANTATWDYFIQNRKNLISQPLEKFTCCFNAEDKIERDYFSILSQDEKRKAAKIIFYRNNEHYFRIQLKAQLGRLLFHDNGYYAVMLKEDKAVKTALDVLNSDAYVKIVKGK